MTAVFTALRCYAAKPWLLIRVAAAINKDRAARRGGRQKSHQKEEESKNSRVVLLSSSVQFVFVCLKCKLQEGGGGGFLVAMEEHTTRIEVTFLIIALK